MSPGPDATAPSPVPDTATQYMVAMRDGVRLATDVYLPAAGSPVPAVLVRLPYDKNSRYVFMAQVARRLTARGYALVVQDVRGKYRSEGEPLGPVSEVRDGYDTIDWVSRQVWCTGRVGTFGDSYYGFTQWAALSAQHPALRAMVPRVTSTDISQFKHVWHGTVVDVPWLRFVGYIASCWTGRYVHEKEPDWDQVPLTEVFEAYFRDVGERSLWYDLMVPRTIPVPVYGEGHPHEARPVPTLHCVGWFDNVATFSMRDYMTLASSPSAGPYQYLYADSHDHENYHLANVPVQPSDDHDTNDEALEKMLDGYIDPAIDFFDVFLREVAGAAAPPRVRWHLGHAGYRESLAWPPPGSQVLTLYLTDLAAAAESAGVLSASQSSAAETCEWDYDPRNLVKSAAENTFAFLFEYPDESERARHPNVLAFESKVLEQPLDLAGPVDLFVRVASSAPSTDIYAKLCDRAPDGSIHQIVRGQGVLTEPGPGSLARIELGHTGYRLRPGHRLYLQVASSDYPEFPPNSGTTENRWTAATRAGSRQVLHTDAALTSHLVLTVVRRRFDEDGILDAAEVIEARAGVFTPIDPR